MRTHSRKKFRKTYDNDLLNVIIRFHAIEERRLSLLSHCLFLLYGQQYKRVAPIIVTQGFNEEGLEKVRAVVKGLPWEDGGRVAPVVINVPVSDGGDYRSKLINVALDHSNGQYVAFLDHDDIIYGGAYTFLINRLKKSQYVVAFGNIKRVDSTPMEGFFYQNRKIAPFVGADRYDMFFENFCPIHSFVIDRKRVSEQDLWFDESMSKSEDYHFLVRLLAKYDGDFGGRFKFVGEYQVRTDGTNTINSEYQQDPSVAKEWKKAHATMEGLFARTEVPITIDRLRFLQGAANGVLQRTAENAARQNQVDRELDQLRHEVEERKKAQDEALKKLSIYEQCFQQILDIGIAQSRGMLKRLGSIDLLAVSDRQIRVAGWACEPESQTRVACVAVLYNGAVLQLARAECDRTDVADALQLSFADVGFDITVPTETRLLESKIEVLCILTDGTISRVGVFPDEINSRSDRSVAQFAAAQ